MFIHLTLWLDELLINPLIHSCTFDVRSARYGTGFYLLVMGIWGHVGHDWGNLRHGRAVEVLWDELKSIWVELRQIWGDVRLIMTSQRRSKQVSKHLRAICDELATVEISYDTFGTIWDILWHLIFDRDEFHGIWLNLRRSETLWIEFESNWVRSRRVSDDWWSSKCESSKMYDLLWVRHICCKFGTISGLSSTIGEEWWHFGFAFEERRRTREIDSKFTKYDTK